MRAGARVKALIIAGLEKVAEKQHFLSLGDKLVWRHSLLAEYLFPGIKNERLATGLAGLTGTVVAFALAYAVAVFLRSTGGRSRKRRRDNTLHRSG